MAATKIRLVQGDTAPDLILSLTDERTGLPIDVSGSGTAVQVLFREVGGDQVKATMNAHPIAGYQNPETQEIEFTPPYMVPGKGGRVVMQWSPTALDTAGEFEAEVETRFQDGRIQTAFGILRFQVREQF